MRQLQLVAYLIKANFMTYQTVNADLIAKYNNVKNKEYIEYAILTKLAPFSF